MYYQIKSNNPFSELEPKKYLMSDISEHIYTQARKAYSNPKGPEMRKALRRAERLSHPGLSEIITNLLLAKEDDHEKILEICEKYVTG